MVLLGLSLVGSGKRVRLNRKKKQHTLFLGSSLGSKFRPRVWKELDVQRGLDHSGAKSTCMHQTDGSFSPGFHRVEVG